MSVSPIALENIHMTILSMHIIDKSLQIDFYRVYNLPTLYLNLKVQFSYVLKGQYLAISASGAYATIPNSLA